MNGRWGRGPPVIATDRPPLAGRGHRSERASAERWLWWRRPARAIAATESNGTYLCGQTELPTGAKEFPTF